MPKKRTLAQNSKMFGIAAKLGIPHDDLQDMAFKVSDGRTEHTSELFIKECDQIIKFLEDKLPKEKTPQRTVNYRKQKAGIKTVPSAKAKKYLRDLWFEFPHRTPDGLKSMCLKSFGHSYPHTAQENSALIEAVKSMNEREDGKINNSKLKEAA